MADDSSPQFGVDEFGPTDDDLQDELDHGDIDEDKDDASSTVDISNVDDSDTSAMDAAIEDFNNYSVMTLNELLQAATQHYLATLDPASPPPPNVIERELITKTNAAIGAHNSGAPKEDKFTRIKTLNFAQVASIMLHLHTICRIAPTGKNSDPDHDLLAMYMSDGPNAGIYVTSDDTFRSVARRYNYSMTTTEFKEVYAAIKDGAMRKYRYESRDEVAVNNGIFDYATKQLLPFTPSKIFLSKTHINYNPDAKNITISHEDGSVWDVESWMESLSDDPEIVNLLWEILGAIIRPHVRWNKSAWFYSQYGNNGKGTLCELMRELVGPNAYASIPLADFSKEFALEPLTRASAIIVDENDVGTFVDKAAILKAIITNDVITINRKHKPVISYQFYGFMVQCLNEFPRFKDKSDSFYRRQLFIHFKKNFTGIERRYIKDDYLHRTEVLEYVLKRVLHDMNYYVLSEPEATKNSLEEFKASNDPVREFFEEFEHSFVWDVLPWSFLYELYIAWYRRTSPSGKPLGRNSFIDSLYIIIQKSDTWYCNDKKQQVRSNESMLLPEPLIVAYDLKDWKNPTYDGKDREKLSTIVPATRYRGIVRKESGPMAVEAS